MNPINSFKKWLLNILVPYIEGSKKEKGEKIIMNAVGLGIIIELFLLIGIVFWIRNLKTNQSRQPSLSKKIIKT